MFADFDENELVKILSCFKLKSVNKNDILLHEGSISKEFYFVQTGCVRIYFVDKNGHEKTRYIIYRLNSQMDNWRTSYHRVLAMAYSFQNRRIAQRVTLTAKQRYEIILNENPALIQQVSNKILASYLDIREETLSRLKSK